MYNLQCENVLRETIPNKNYFLQHMSCYGNPHTMTNNCLGVTQTIVHVDTSVVNKVCMSQAI